jgi:glycosyltransferase involved in cell wall biosynthesis
VVTHHGPDYDRQKWGRFARLMLQLGERWGMRWSNGRIVISKVIADLVLAKQGMKSALIPNGVALPLLPDSMAALEQFDLTPGRYVLLVSRLVQEKRHLDLIAAFKQANLADWKLVLVGGADHPDAYQRRILEYAAEAGVVMTGFQSGLALQELYAHAGFFVLPSSHEGLPIALLEALSYGLPVLASDIPANLEVGLSAEQYFPLGDIDVLAERMRLLSGKSITLEVREKARLWVSQRYDWRDIADKTLKLYVSCLGKNRI